MTTSLLALMRPRHWVKNLVIFAALFFSFSFTTGDLVLSLQAFIAFCLLASVVYILNDIRDAERDRQHPIKKDRPIASGALSPTTASILAIALLGIAWYLASRVNQETVWALGSYILINFFYNFWLKGVAVIDVIVVATGFVIRVIAGAMAIQVSVSHWILLCTFFLALFLAFGKRKHEMMVLSDDRAAHRSSLEEYTGQFIDQMLALTAGISVVFYSLYTIDIRTVNSFQTDNLIYTTPIVVFAVFRYFFLLYNKNQGGDPVQLFIKDRLLLGSIIVWLASVLLIWFYYVRLPMS
jgi:4-hydroxybenzoate polyprenyltransferase